MASPRMSAGSMDDRVLPRCPVFPSSRSWALKLQNGAKSSASCRLIARMARIKALSEIAPDDMLMTEIIIERRSLLTSRCLTPNTPHRFKPPLSGDFARGQANPWQCLEPVFLLRVVHGGCLERKSV